jgi:crossover junction endodeoxyribonuclease RusA
MSGMLLPPLYADSVQAIISLRLPTPPSVNNLYFNLKNGGRAKTQHYKDWIAAADAALMEHRAEIGHPIPRIIGPYAMRLTVEFPTKRRRDLSNVLKALEDFCVQRGLVEDDSMMRRLEMERAPLPGKTVRLSIISTR